MFLSIKNIPKVYWSSNDSFNLKPKFSTSFFLIFGLIVFGFGEGLLILSTTGNSPWSVLAEGISNISNLSIGAATFLVSVTVLFFWIFLKLKPGLGTIFNIIIIHNSMFENNENKYIFLNKTTWHICKKFLQIFCTKWLFVSS